MHPIGVMCFGRMSILSFGAGVFEAAPGAGEGFGAPAVEVKVCESF